MPRIADAVGRVLGGRYRLLAPVGSGASAVVYVAEDVSLHRRVAVKLLHGALAEDEGFLRRFRDEARAAAGLTHPNIMRVYDWGEDDDGPFLVLELLGGGSLRDILDAGHLLTPSQVLGVGLEAARALDYAHRRGLVHRDIKPANLLFDDEARLCIADFGLARALAEAALTEPSGAVLGTARYAAPEQARGASLDGRADVYALALVLVEAATGHVPFAADTTIGTLMARVGTDLDVPGELGPLVPVLERAGAADPADRLDAAGLARQLDAAASKLPPPARLPLAPPGTETQLRPRARPDDLTDHGVPSAAVAGGTAAAAGRSRVFSTRRALQALALVLALLLVAGGGVAIAQARVASHPVPELRNQTVASAEQEAREANLRVRVQQQYSERVPRDIVIRQSPAAGERLKENRRIQLVVSRGPPPVAIPGGLIGVDEATARRLLAEAGLVVGGITRPFSDAHDAGAVMDFAPKGPRVPKGSTIDLVISAGPTPVVVPHVGGLTYDEAATELRKAGFVPSRLDVFDETVEVGRIVGTTPAAGEQAQPTTRVVARVSKGPERIAVPDVIGEKVDDAKRQLVQAGLEVGGVYGPPKRDRVRDTYPQVGQRVKRGTPIDLYV